MGIDVEMSQIFAGEMAFIQAKRSFRRNCLDSNSRFPLFGMGVWVGGGRGKGACVTYDFELFCC